MMRTRVHQIVAILLFSTGSSLPAGAQGLGSIGGSVNDTSGAALPGVAVALSSPGVIGGNQEAVTDSRGAYAFPRLVPGTYTVRASVTGFRAAGQEWIVVNAGVTSRVAPRLEI